MLEKLFFYDGNLENISTEDMPECEVIDAKYGVTANLQALRKIINKKSGFMVLTNQVAALNMEWLWSKETHRTKLLLLDEHDQVWKRAERFTKKQIKFNTNIEAFYLRGEFRTEKAYRDLCKKVPRRFIEFKI